MVEYLGTWQGALLLRRGNTYFQQSDDGALGPKWREFRISKAEAETIMAMGRTQYDMVFGYNDDNIPPPADEPFWRTNPVEYLSWHRDHDPSPWSEMADQALQKLGESAPRRSH
jgi:hypothetical protein